jgi:PHD/YefM family antitoxin component YafN of YafNO toxin-antitoxin module
MKPIGIAEARRRLPELAARVAQRTGETVVIENRRRGDRVVLTAESYLRGLEAIVEESRKQQGGEAFVLEGSITSELQGDALEQAMVALRRERNASRLGRLADIA